MLIQEDQISLQNVVQRLQAQFAPSDDTSADLARQEYHQILKITRVGTVSPQRQYQDWNKALSKAHTYQIPEINGFLVTKDFLEAISVKLVLVQRAQQLTNIVVAKELGEPVCTLDQFGCAFESLIQYILFQKGTRYRVFITLDRHSDSQKGYNCLYKESQDKYYPWKPTEYLIVELAIRGTSEHSVSLVPSKQELDAVRTRLQLRMYNDLRAQLSKKGQPVSSIGGSMPVREASGGSVYSGSIEA